MSRIYNTANISTFGTIDTSPINIEIHTASGLEWGSNVYEPFAPSSGASDSEIHAIRNGRYPKSRKAPLKFYFKFVKSKLTKLQQVRLQERLEKLKALVMQAKFSGQQALYEEFAFQLAVTVRESEILACGIEYIIDRAVVERFMHNVRDVEVKLDKLEDYPRVLPAKVQKALKNFKQLNLFDTYLILYGDHKGKVQTKEEKEQEKATGKKLEKEVKTTKKKIKEKDPILFGVQEYLHDRLYFIMDWIDEHCDLTLDKFLEVVKTEDPLYELDRIPEMDNKLMKEIIKDAKDRNQRLEGTNRSNYKNLMVEEDRATRLLNKLFLGKLIIQQTMDKIKGIFQKKDKE